MAVIREPLDEPDVFQDIVSVEIAPAFPPYTVHDGATLSRRVGIRGKDSYNELEAAFVVNVEWSSVDVGPKSTEIIGSGPSTYRDDPAPPVQEFIAQVEQSAIVAKLRGADNAFHGWRASYQPPEERD